MALGIAATLFDSSYVFSRMIGHTERLQKAVEMVKYLSFSFSTKGSKNAAVKKERPFRARTLHFTSLVVKFYTINK